LTFVLARRDASDTKKSLHECASASAGVSGRFRSGCEQEYRLPPMVTVRRHMRDVSGAMTPDSSAATSVTAFISEPGRIGVSSTSGLDSRLPAGSSSARISQAAPCGGCA
jgi:hypothetical protein